MKDHCTIHDDKESISICFSCKRPFCQNCLREGNRHYYCFDEDCSKMYLEEIDYKNNPRFCSECRASSLDESSGNLFTLNFIGTSFVGKKDFCDLCGSFITTKYFVLFGIPIIKLGRYRILEIEKVYESMRDKINFLSRKIPKN